MVVLDELYRMYSVRLLRYSMHRLRNAQLAEDVASEVWLRAVRYRARSWDWLYRCLRHVLADQFRGTPGLRWQESPLWSDDLIDPESDVERQAEAEIDCERVMARLTAMQRRVMVMVRDGYESGEIATALGTTTGAVKALRHRSRQPMEAEMSSE